MSRLKEWRLPDFRMRCLKVKLFHSELPMLREREILSLNSSAWSSPIPLYLGPPLSAHSVPAAKPLEETP